MKIRCLALIANMVKNKQIDASILSDLPKNLIASLLNIFSKRGYLTDTNIEIVSKQIYFFIYKKNSFLYN